MRGGSPSDGRAARVKPYDMPYGCLVPRQIDGLLLAGRGISGSHDAQASYSRKERSCRPWRIPTNHAEGWPAGCHQVRMSSSTANRACRLLVSKIARILWRQGPFCVLTASMEKWLVPPPALNGNSNMDC